MKKRIKTKKMLILSLILIITLIVIYAMYIEPRQLTCQNVTLTVPKIPSALDGFKIGVVSDLHLRPSVMDNSLFDKMFAELKKHSPDIIFITGDFMNKKDFMGNLSYAEITNFLTKFSAPYGVYAVSGNHDMQYLSYGLRHVISKANIKLLENTLINVNIKGYDLQLAGVNDYTTRHAYIEDALRTADRSKFIILLSHNPKIFLHHQNFADLTISGHTHGGQIRVPLLFNTPSSIVQLNTPFDRGIYTTKDKQRTLALTSGVGTSLAEIRLGIPPEIMIITLKEK